MKECREKVVIHVADRGDIEACKGDNLGLILAGKGLLPLPCGGRGLCGLCRVRVRGGVSPPTSYELVRRMGEEERLACQVRVLGEAWVEVPRIGLVRAPVFSLNITPRARKPLVVPATMHSLIGDLRPLYKPYPGDLRPLIFGDEIIATGGDPSRILLVDMGTTKIAYQLVDPEGDLIGEGLRPNPLNVYGADIITRITRIMDEPGLLEAMAGKLRETIMGLAGDGEPGIVVVAGNSVMTHILHGLPIESLAVKPYQPLIRGPVTSWHHGVPIVSAPLIAGYVGGDAYSELVASLEMDPPRPYMIIDLGTNTETILVTDNGVLATSTPAGPAFEGHLHSGSTAYYGGVVGAEIKGFDEYDRPIFETRIIGEPRGLLGTGLISVVAELYRHGVIDHTGRIRSGYVRRNGVKTIIIDDEHDIVITQKDIREFQKALSAVRTSWKILLRRAGLEPGNLRMVFIAGSFGSGIEERDLIDLSIAPVKDSSRILYAGNMVLTGLRVMLLNKDYFTEYRRIINMIKHINLAEQPGYMEEWIKNLDLSS